MHQYASSSNADEVENEKIAPRVVSKVFGQILHHSARGARIDLAKTGTRRLVTVAPETPRKLLRADTKMCPWKRATSRRIHGHIQQGFIFASIYFRPRLT
jgi:uncharacterized protein YjhX (UPF0386 family)